MYQYLLDRLDKYDMYIYDCTPDCIDGNRPYEILQWLQANKNKVDRCIILDDDFEKTEYEKYHLEDFLVKTNWYGDDITKGGLQKEHVKLAIKKLTGDKNETRKTYIW